MSSVYIGSNVPGACEFDVEDGKNSGMDRGLSIDLVDMNTESNALILDLEGGRVRMTAAGLAARMSAVRTFVHSR